MDIVKLYTNPNGTLKAAHIQDGTESYPVLIEALGSTTLLPELINSGWQLHELPLKLVKNGMPLESLPKAEWTPAMEQQYGQDMYDMLGTPMPIEERRKFLYRGTTVTAFATVNKYKYNTREEFLDYLRSIKNGVPEEDYMPLNCLVAPNARFTIDEFISQENKEFVTIITSRRNMSYTRYVQLVAFLKQFGLPDTFNGKDLLKCYHQWGVDGVQFATVGTPTIEPAYIVEGGYGEAGTVASIGMLPATKQVYVLVKKTVAGGYDVICPAGIKPNDLYGYSQIRPYNAFTDEEERRIHRFEMEPLEYERAKLLQPGEAMALRRHVRAPSFRLEMQVSGSPICDTIKVSYKTIAFGDVFRVPGFSFRTSANTMMPVDYIGDQAAARQSAYMMAIAKDIVARRKKPSNRSLFSALQECGFSMLTSLNYALSTNGIGIPRDTPNPDEDGTIMPAMSRETLVQFVLAKSNPDIEQETLENLPLESTFGVDLEEARQLAVELLNGTVDGTVAGDFELFKAITAEDAVTPTEYYEAFRALIDCTPITMNEIYDQVKEWVPGNPVVVTAPDGTTVKLKGTVMSLVESKYQDLKQRIRLNQATQSAYYVWIDGAIKALGDPDYNKHSGFFCSVLNMKSSKCQDVRRKFSYYYVDRVMADIEKLKDVNYGRWNTLMHSYLGVPNTTDTPDYGDIPMIRLNTGVAQYVAATMMMQMLKTGIARLPLPSGAVTISTKDVPELADALNSIRKFMMNTTTSFFCDCQSFCDYVTSAVPGQLQYWLYPVNAIVTPDRILPRPGFRIVEYDGVFSYNYSTFYNIYENQGTLDKLPPVFMRKFYIDNELQKRSLEDDLIYACISGHITGFKSYMQQYYQEALAVANEWRDGGNAEHLDAVTGPWEAAWSIAGVQAISSGRAEPDKSGLPCFKPYNVPKMLEPEKHVVEDTVFAVKLFDGVTAEEYRNGVGEIVSPPRRGRVGFLMVDGDFITVCAMDSSVEPRTINPSDIASLNPGDYPVHHIYGSRWLLRDVSGTLYYVEV